MTITFPTLAITDLRIAFPAKNIQLDPQKIEDMYSMTIVNQLYSRLVRYTPDGQIRLDLASSWEVSTDKKKYTFHLKNMNFSDGTKIKAIHVENSLKRIFFLGSSLSSDLAIISGSEVFKKTKNTNDLKIKSLDESSLEIETKLPTSLLMYLLAVPDAGILKITSPQEKILVDSSLPFSGVYKLKYSDKDKFILEKWRLSELDSKQPPKKIVINLLEGISPNLLRNGQISDTSNFMTFDEKKSELANDPNWHTVPSEATNERFIILNPKKIPKKIRLWLSSKIDTNEFVKNLDDKSIEPAYGFIPNCLPGHLKQQIKIIPSPALKLSKTFALDISFGANLPYQDKFKTYLRAAWKHDKIQLNFHELPVGEYLKTVIQKKGAAVIAAKGLDYPEGFSTISYFRSDIEGNLFFVNNKKVDALIDQSSHELENLKRSQLYQEIQKEVLQDATMIPLAFGSWKKYFWSKRVEYIPPHPIGVHFIPFEMIVMADK